MCEMISAMLGYFVLHCIKQRISVPALYLLEGQKRPVSDIESNALEDVLNVSVEWLLGREE